jgi:hypothetical protein
MMGAQGAGIGRMQHPQPADYLGQQPQHPAHLLKDVA